MNDYTFLHRKLIQVMQSVIDEIDWANWHLLTESNPDNPSSSLDKAVNSLLYKRLQRIIDYPIVSEETYNATGEMPTSDYVWIVDPIDGTINLLAGTDDFGVAVALAETESLKPIISSIAIPLRKTIFSAATGLGSFKDGQPLVANKSKDSPNILSYGIPGDAYLFSSSITKKLKLLIESKWILRQGGAAALDICRTAQKQWKAFWEPNLFLWDFVAAELIAMESGCTIYKRERDSKYLRYDLLVISSKKEVSQLVRLLLD